MMDDDRYPADWRVAFPSPCDLAAVWGLLDDCRLCNSSVNPFSWDLRGLRRLLEECPPEFDYLYLTRFLKSRAAGLAMTGPFESSQLTVLEGIAHHRLQFALIYRCLFRLGLDHALSNRPSSRGQGLNDPRLFRVNLGRIDRMFLEVLEVACLLPDPEDTELHGVRISDWVAGGKGVSSVSPVMVSVDVEEMGWYRKVKPPREELARKIKSCDRTRCFFRERNGHGTACDRVLEHLCGMQKLGGFPTIACGEDSIEYYGATTNREKNTLYLVCADCTMRIMQSGEIAPGCRPVAIGLGWPSMERKACSLDREVEYLVEFEDGTSDLFMLSFRAHQDNEKPDVPRSNRPYVGFLKESDWDVSETPHAENDNQHKRSMAEDKGMSENPPVAKDDGDETDAADTDRRQAAAVVGLATRLDVNPRLKAPTHAAVLRLFCIEGLSIKEIEKRLKCSHGTVMNRKRNLERQLGSLDRFRNLASYMDDMEKAMRDPRARSIYRRGMTS